MAACLAGELRLSLPVGPLAMTAGRTGPRRIPRVDRHHGDPGQFRLVRHEAVELRERPSREPVARVGAPSRDPFADAGEILKGDPPIGASGVIDDRLADGVVDVAAESGLLAGHPPEFLPRPLVPLRWSRLRWRLCFRRTRSTSLPECRLPSESVAMSAMPRWIPMRSSVGIGGPSGMLTVTSRNHQHYTLETRTIGETID